MRRVDYRLRVMVPDDIHYDETVDEGDSEEDFLLRYLGGHLNTIESIFSDQLPEGWYAKIEGGEFIG